MAEAPLVVLRHPEKDITVPEEILMACSPVLGGILRDAAEPEEGGNKILTIDDVSLEALEAFVGQVTINSYAPTDISLTIDDLAKSAELLMPLIHKYDCKGLLIRLHEAVNSKPEKTSIFAILEYETDSDWMRPDSLDCLAANAFKKKWLDLYKQSSDIDEEILEGLPPSVLVRLLVHMVTKATLGSVNSGSNHKDNLVGEKYVIRSND